MNVIQRPGNQEFCKDMPDYIIDTDNTIRFSIRYRNKIVLDEEYTPDANFQVRIRRLGSFCALALWGKWSNADSFVQDEAAGVFTFLIDDVEDASSYVIFSRMKTRKDAASPGWLTEIREKVTRAGITEYLSGLFSAGDQVVVTARTDTKATGSVTIYTHAGDKGVVTLDVSPGKIPFPNLPGEIQSYSVICGDHAFKFIVDSTPYIDLITFRCKNVFDMPETVVTVGGLSFKGNNEDDTAMLFGIERKFSVKSTDEYVANSGVIFLQSDYKLWHNFVNAQETQIYQNGWMSVVVSKQSFEREMSKGALKEVEFTFRMADPEQNNLLEVL